MGLWVRVSPFTFIEDTLSYTSKECVRKHTQSKKKTFGTGDPMKEIKKMLEDKNDTKVRTSTGGPLKNKGMPSDKKTKPGK